MGHNNKYVGSCHQKEKIY